LTVVAGLSWHVAGEAMKCEFLSRAGSWAHILMPFSLQVGEILWFS
jgi:hypothetical protein